MFDIGENLKKLPACPGVYLHKDGLGQVIYVGKAISLKNRVRQYFQESSMNNPKTKALRENIAEFEYITCETEMEALILECNLIKRYRPKYNILLRDDKTYPYIMVTTSEPFPKVVKTRIIKKDKNKYFGPYSDASAVNDIVELLNSIYKLKRCNYTSFPKNFRPCLNYHIDQCKGICINKVSREEYMKSIDEIVDFLNGNEGKLIDFLSESMMEASKSLNFEEAAKFRDYITAAKTLGQTQRVTISSYKDMDIILAARSPNNVFAAVYYIREGKLSGRDIFPLESNLDEDKKQIIGEFIKQYYVNLSKLPGEILVDTLPDDYKIIEDFLSDQTGHRVSLVVPKRSEKKQLLDLAQKSLFDMVDTLEEKAKNAREKEDRLYESIRKIILEAGYNRKPNEVNRIYKKDYPRREYRIESYDISNTNGIDSVGAMVVFQGARPIKKDYRRFIIKTVVGADDYGSLEEVLSRRFNRFINGDLSFSNLPDIIFMDGGLGQVRVAEKVLDQLGISLPVVGLAKDSSHRTRAIVFGDGREINLKEFPLLFQYSGRIQEEVHRFAIEYHRSKKSKRVITSVLDNIEGVGERRRNALLEKFGSVDKIKTLDENQLMEAEGITRGVAENIIRFFKK